MATNRPLCSKLLQPVQLRLDGLHERLAHLDQIFAEAPGGLPDDVQQLLERAVLFRSLNGVLRSYEAIMTTICLVVDGSVPDDENSWYEDALRQVTGNGSGRVPILQPALAELLKDVGVYPDCDPILDPRRNLEIQRQRHATAVRAAPLLVEALSALDRQIIDGTLRMGCAPDPEFVAQHQGRMGRAKARAQALQRALRGIEATFLDQGHTVVPFGSLIEGRVHGRSDLDLLVPGKVSREERSTLWTIAEDVTRTEGVEVDLHFPALYDGDFLDRIKVTTDGRITPLRDFISFSTTPKTTT